MDQTPKLSFINQKATYLNLAAPMDKRGDDSDRENWSVIVVFLVHEIEHRLYCVFPDVPLSLRWSSYSFPKVGPWYVGNSVNVEEYIWKLAA